ncbi:Proline--tRNA ligase [Candidatus Tiddalikarchaeum anstoanum]|nr:Proline--tRNA ligase [Candidatus Tiddalikarchaeum anstoanum]
MTEHKITYDDVINLAQRRSLFFPSSEIYTGYLAGFFDYGPYGAAIKRKIVDMWRKDLVQKEDFFEIDGAIVMSEDVFNSSGHLKNFKDPITRCTKCKSIFRADKLLEENVKDGNFKEAMSNEELTKALRQNKIICPKCTGQLMDVDKASLMVEVKVGVARDKGTYLRPESCQSIFLDFARLTKTMRLKLPKGVSQYGKVFRNEISPRQSLIRSIEFSQMETEVFFDPAKINDIENFEQVEDYEIMIQRAGDKSTKPIKAKDLVAKKLVSGKLIAYYLARTQELYEKYGIKKEDMRFRELDSDERAFYAKEAFDFEVRTSIGWVELIANNYRTDYDIKGHMEGSKEDLRYTDDKGNRLIPHIWEISIGVDRTFYAIIENSMRIEGDRTLLSLPARIAPIDVAIFPLLSNKEELTKKAKELYYLLRCNFDVFYDESGSIGKRYARMDEVGVHFCVTVDFDTAGTDTVTLRERDSTKQERVKISELKNILSAKIRPC